jgi:ELWxxDGT repeat protein
MVGWRQSKARPVGKGARNPLERSRQRLPLGRRLRLECLEGRHLLSAIELLQDIDPGAPDSSPGEFLAIGSSTYFAANETELWKTDGTPAGTARVLDTGPGSGMGGAVIGNFLDANGTLVFGRIDRGQTPDPLETDDDRFSLWKSDGTTLGTVLVKDFGPGSWTNPSAEDDLVAVGGTVFGAIGTPDSGVELWTSDLNPDNPNGTVLVKDINPGMAGSLPGSLLGFGGKLYFSADDGSETELWESDGTSTGTVPWDVKPGTWVGGNPKSSDPAGMTVWGTQFVFRAFDAGPDNIPATADDSVQLWRSNGTLAGTVLVKDFGPGSDSWEPQFTPAGGLLFAVIETPATGEELWKSNGTEAGTVLVKDIRSGPDSASPFAVTNVNGMLFFAADDGIHGVELWKSDGTAAGTTLVKDIIPDAPSSWPDALTDVNGVLYFKAQDDSHGGALWRSNGSEADTWLVGEVNPGEGSDQLLNLTFANSTLFFSAYQPATGQEAWKITFDVAAPTWYNAANPGDVDDSGAVTSLDALILINYINAHPGETSLPPPPAEPHPFYDVDDNNACTAQDVLLVINYLNSGAADGEGEASEEWTLPALTEATAAPRTPDAMHSSGSLVTRCESLVTRCESLVTRCESLVTRCESLVTRLCLVTHWLRDPASRLVGGADKTVRSQAEPGNEKTLSLAELDAVFDEIGELN